MKIFDTSQKDYVTFEKKPIIKIYICGITPYDSAHLGHIFTFMTYDILQRYLEDEGSEVQLVRNVTDVDEPIYTRAKSLGISYKELAKAETNSFQSVMARLNFRTPYAEPLASEYIPEMAEAVDRLLKTGFGYRLESDIYFDTSKVAEFGKFSGFSERLRLTYMRLRGGDPERAGKRQPLDFLLWKGITDEHDPARWETVVGSGRPGWHIECTVMSDTILGIPFDLHGGGTDLIFPHHESEIAQSFGLHGEAPARHWMHVSPLFHNGEKMSKSLGNLVFAKDLLEHFDADTIRLALMHYHRRIGGEWQSELLDEASRVLDCCTQKAAACSPNQAKKLLVHIKNAIEDDVNTLEVIIGLHNFIESKKYNVKTSEATKTVLSRAFNILGLTSIQS